MKDVFIMTNNMNGGGAERVLLTLLNHLPPERFNVELCLVYNEGVLIEQLPKHINVSVLFEKGDSQASKNIHNDTGELYRRAVKKEYDIEIAFLEGNSVKIMSQSTNYQALKIAWVHIDLSQQHYTLSVFGSIEKEYNAFSAFDKIFCVSSDVRDGLIKLFGEKLRSKEFVVFNPIDQSKITALATETTPPKHEITFCAVGRLVEQKRFDRLIYATERLHNEGQRFNIWILGEGSLELQLRQKCLELGLMNIFSFLGFQKNPYPYIRCADALISCSMAEGLSMVIGEALILKTPIIATNCGGQSEALQGGKYGLLVENSTTGVYEGMKAFLTHEYTGNEIKCGDPNRFRPYELNHYIKRICELME